MYRPSVSIIVPARNEERYITTALRSLAALEYTNVEIIVVDDRSTDATHSLAEQFINTYRGDKKIQLLRSPGEPPAGWVGKTFAADFAITRSSGELILVCDADVSHTHTSLHNTVAMMRSKDLDLLSQLPHFDIRSVGEYPLLFQTFLLYLSSRIAHLLGSRQSFVMGTYLMFTREFYTRSGGWRAHRSYPESLPLLNYCIAHGGRFAFVPDHGFVRSRMHEGTAATFWGLVRNSNFALLQPLPLAVFIALVTLFAAAFAGAAQGSLLGTAVCVYFIVAFATHLMRGGYPLSLVAAASVLFIFAPLYLTAVALCALMRQLFDLPTQWRGRLMRPQ